MNVLDYLFGLSVTAVGVLEGRQCAPGDALGRSHHPLESPVGQVASHSGCSHASVKVCEGLRGQVIFLQPEVEEAL